MNYSLLYKTGNSHGNSNILPGYMIDRIFEIISPGSNISSFVSVLSKPCLKTDDITYRRGIIKDFISNPRLFESLEQAFLRYDRFLSDIESFKKDNYIYRLNSGLKSEYDCLRSISLFPQTIVSSLRGISKIVRENKCGTLSGLSSKINDIIDSDEVVSLVNLCERFRVSFDEANITTYFDINSLGDIESVSTPLINKLSKEKRKITQLFSKNGSAESGYTSDNDSGVSELTSYSLKRFSTRLYNIICSLYNLFYGISSELEFYKTALDYISYLDKHNIEYVFADFSGDGYSFENLKDLYLVTSIGKDSTVGNDFKNNPNHKGEIIRGENNSGKTTFLRSVALAFIFSSAGLPVTADSAQIKTYHSVKAHFSGTEDQLNDIGRFEKEAREIKELISSRSRDSVFLFNESFQSTSDSEGSKALSQILRYLEELDNNYILVTHLDEIVSGENYNVLNAGLYNVDLNTHKITAEGE